MEPDWIYRIASAADRAVQSFDPEELAFLALTGKIETAMRDRVAWQVYGSFPCPPMCTTREWRNTDPAIIEAGDPVVLLETKAFYSFDAANPVTLAKYQGYIHADIEKAGKLAVADTQVMVAVFMTHVAAPVSDEFDGIVKYRNDINKAIAQFGSDALYDFAARRVEGILNSLGPTKRTTSPVGEAFGVPAQVNAWVTLVKSQPSSRSVSV